MTTQTITLHGVELTVHFTINGKYYAATRETPEEYPEIEIQKITASDSDIDLTDLLEKYNEDIYNLIEV